MCNYGHGNRDTTPEDVNNIFDNINSEYPTLILGSSGSILDESEFSQECFDLLLRRVSDSSFKNVYFETHCTTITDIAMKQVKNRLPNKKHII
jgi:uncharacterized Fe-S cluster-containing MiaB family protein